MQDMAGLIGLFGGDEPFNAELDKFFAYAHPTWTGQFYNPYNETDLQAPFLYDYSGTPWKTQSRVRELLADAYGTTPSGIPGNDDCGTMSAWYVFAALGLYPTDPARPAYELSAPLFPARRRASGRRRTRSDSSPSRPRTPRPRTSMCAACASAARPGRSRG